MNCILKLFVFYLVSLCFFSEAQANWKSQRNDFKSEISYWEKMFRVYDSKTVVYHSAEKPEIILKTVSLDKYSKKDLEKFKLELQKKNKGVRIRYQNGLADTFKAAINRFLPWRSSLERIMLKYDVPTSLLAMVFVESMFQSEALSKVKAGGIWQIMKPTAKEYGLIVNSKNDERKNILISTDAAARILRRYQRYSKNWPITVAGYNSGLYGLAREARRKKTDNLRDLLTKTRREKVGFASLHFYPSVVAASKVLETALKEKQVEKASRLAGFKLLKGENMSLKKWASQLTCSLKEIKALNPNLSSIKVPTKKLAVPSSCSLRSDKRSL